jgi:glycine/D-amino acid oxidase-like deaminating enzyme
MSRVPEQAEVVIVGGGVMGTSIAFHLAEAGVGDVVLLERDRLGSGSSAKPLGGVRATFSDPGNIRLGLRSLEAFERFGERFGIDIGLRQVGYLFLCRTDAELAEVERSTAVQRELGGSARMVSPSEACKLNPLLREEALVGASFSPRDGYANPAAVVQGYRQAAEALGGATVLEHIELQGVALGSAGIEEVHTDHGTVRTGRLICAAGAWSEVVGRMVGVDLPIEPVRRQIGLAPGSFPTVPFTLDLSTTMYLHNYERGLLLGISNRDQQPGFDRSYSDEWRPAFDSAAQVVAPSLAGLPLESGWAGLYENTPDHNALIGASAAVPGFYYATGFSGHGFLQAPAVGEVVRDLYLERTPFMDVAAFSAERFAGSRAVHEVHII